MKARSARQLARSAWLLARERLPWPDAVRLVRAGVIDRSYYAAQADRPFSSDVAAAAHYLRSGRRSALAPNVLFEPEWYLPTGWRRRPDPLLHWVATADRPDHYRETGPLFDPTAHLAAHPESVRHPGGALGDALRSPASGEPLPVPVSVRAAWPGGVPTMARARAVLLRIAREDASRRALRRPRRTAVWDTEREQRFLAARPGGPTAGADASGEPLVSVIMPVRDRAAQVGTAIASVRAQTLDRWELLVVDDGSSDGTPEVLSAEAAADPRIRVLTRPASGVSAARNAGIAAAGGRWIAFLDSDNAWVPRFLELMVAVLGGDDDGERAARAVADSGVPGPRRYLAFEPADGAAAGLPDEEVLDRGDRLRRWGAREVELEHLLVLNHVDLNTLVLERSLLQEVGGFDERLRRWVDHDLAIAVARRTAIPLVPFVGVHYDDSEDGPHHAAHPSPPGGDHAQVVAGRAPPPGGVHAPGVGPDAVAAGSGRISRTESEHWQYVVLAKHLIDWPALETALPQRMADRVSISMPTYQDWSMTLRAVRAVLAAADEAGDDVEVLVVDNGSRRSIPAILRAALGGEPRVRILSQARNLHFATGSNLGFAASSGQTVVFLNNDTVVTQGWLAPLRAALEDPGIRGVQPLLLYPDGTVQSAGTAFLTPGALPGPLLADHPAEDARRAGLLRLPVVTAAALAMRAKDIVTLRGFDPLYVNGFEDVDLCLRAVRDLGGTFAVEPRSVVVHDESRTPGRGSRIPENRRIFLERWSGRMPEPDRNVLERLGFQVTGLEWDRAPRRADGDGQADPPDIAVPRPVLRRPARAVIDGPAAGRPALRWALKLFEPAGPDGDATPAAAFAARLAVELERLGQEVAVDRLEAHRRRTALLDDVAVLLAPADDHALDGLAGGVVLQCASGPATERAAELLDRAEAALTAENDTTCRKPTI